MQHICALLTSHGPVQVLQDAQSMDAGIVTLGASQTVATYLIPPLLGPFRRANPQVASCPGLSQLLYQAWLCLR